MGTGNGKDIGDLSVRSALPASYLSVDSLSRSSLVMFVLKQRVLRVCEITTMLNRNITGKSPFLTPNSLIGLVVKVFTSKAEDLGFESRMRQDFSGSSHTSDVNIGTPVATLPGAWRL